jgi:uncharacterized membrane protein
MKPLAIALCILCQFLIVIGQLFLKHAMAAPPGTPQRAKVINFTLGIGSQALWFFLWVGLLAETELSKLFPFEGLNPALVALSAWLFLKERMPLGAWVGLLILCAGIALVASS